MPRPGFLIADAYAFANQNDLTQDAENIASMAIHPSISKPATVRKGCFIELFERSQLMERFVEVHWPSRHTPSGEQKYAQFLGRKALNERRLSEEASDDDGEEEDDFDEAPAFALEAHLRDFIADNLQKISVDTKKVAVFKDGSGRAGIEYPTDVGYIDILGISDEGTFYIFELKLSRGADRAVGQLARYMGWVKRNLADGKKVVGVVVASAIDQKTRYAASIIPDVILLEYEVQFRMTTVSVDE